ncbi:MAG: hypothetical protein GTN69_06920 [Armatimonadetes bacterium]|nr:hypothetical protein [Armatimonadota bacterium]
MTYPSRPAEAVTFRELFTNPATLHANGGVLTGTPLVQNGVHLDGSTQYVTYTISSRTFYRKQIAIVTEFYPDFDYDGDINAYLYDAQSGKRYYVIKCDNSANNELYIGLGNVLVSIVAPATFGPYWRQGQRNVLVVTGEPGDVDVWLNGTQIVTGDSTSWSLKDPTTLYIGTWNLINYRFDGVITGFSVHSRRLTQADVDGIQDHSLFTYQNSADLWADMATAIVDGSNDRTPDKSRRGKTVLLGDGAGTGTPVFSDPGFLFDGSSDYMTLPTAPTGNFTVVTKRSEDLVPVFENDLTTRNKIKTAGQFDGTLEFLGEWPFLLSPIQRDDLEYRLRGIR